MLVLPKMKAKNIKIFVKIVLILSAVLFSATKSQAQLNIMGSGYYQNLYLFNPAMSGLEQKLQLYTGIRQQFNSFPGAPVTQVVAADYAFAEKASAGILFNNDKAGILNQQRIGGSFAYHLPLNSDDQKIHFGVAMTFSNDRLNSTGINGDIRDPDINDVNNRETYLDGGFGAAYTSNSLQIQFTLPNMKYVFKKDLYDAADRSLFFSSVSYRFRTSLGKLEPKLVFRGVEGYDNLIDAGVNLELNPIGDNKLNMFALYHSAKSATVGFGITYKRTLTINGMYTTSTSPLQGYTNGDFEISIGYSIW